MRLSNFSYGIIGATLFAALVVWQFKGKVDHNSDSSTTTTKKKL